MCLGSATVGDNLSRYACAFAKAAVSVRVRAKDCYWHRMLHSMLRSYSIGDAWRRAVSAVPRAAAEPAFGPHEASVMELETTNG